MAKCRHPIVSKIGKGLLLSSFVISVNVWAGDSDKDGIDDIADNCTQTANPNQKDSNANGYGNACDGDLNSDGKVNALDLGMFKQRFGKDNPDADLNDDGRVNALDLGRIKLLFGKKQGPSAVIPDPKLANNPPPAENVEIFALVKPVSPNQDGMIQMTFSPEVAKKFSLGEKLVVNGGDQPQVLNDAGISPDQKAGDLVFSGFVNIDEGEMLKNIDNFKSRFTAALRERKIEEGGNDNIPLDQLPVGLFNKRELIKTVGVDLNSFEPGLPISPNLDRFRPLPACIGSPTPLPPTCPEGRCLAITDLSVVADPSRTYDPCDTDGDSNLGNANGAWSFKTLMTNMANQSMTGVTPQQFTHAWLKKWLTNDTVNGFTVPNRNFGMTTTILNKIPGWNLSDPSTLDMDKLPFRLLAIINRVDLAKGGYMGSGSPGEIRLVFGLLQDANNPAICRPHDLGMGVILEYGDVKQGCSGTRARANDWFDLHNNHPAFPSASYNSALQAITDQVTTVNAAPLKPNGSALNQLRTNDVALGFPWEFREFTIDASSKLLKHDTLKQTPDFSFNFGNALSSFINSNGVAVCNQNHTVSNSFLAGSLGYGPTFFFNGSIATPVLAAGSCSAAEVRHRFSLNTCGGCHGAEALDPNVNFANLGLSWPFTAASTPESFYHVDARTPPGQPARLSRFMTGTNTTTPFTNIPDPVVPSNLHQFDDLTRRGQIMQQLATQNCNCFPMLSIEPVLSERLAPTPFILDQLSITDVH